MLVSRYDLAPFMEERILQSIIIATEREMSATVTKVKYKDVKQKNRTINQRFEVRYYDIDKMMDVFKIEVARPTTKQIEARQWKIKLLEKIKKELLLKIERKTNDKIL